MSTTETNDACFAVKAKIQQFFKNKLMYQYKKEKWQNNASDFLEIELRNLHNEIVKEVNECNKQIHDEIQKQFENKIDKPSTSIGTRFKFLFTGKF